MALALSVVKAFEQYQRGQHITDPDVVDEIKGGPYAHNVVQCVLPDEYVAALNAKAAASAEPETTETPTPAKGKAKAAS